MEEIYVMIEYLCNGKVYKEVRDLRYDRIVPILNTKKAILNGVEIEIINMKRL